MSNKQSLLFSDEEIIYHRDYDLSVESNIFLNKIKEYCEYEQDFTFKKVVELEKAEKVLLFIKELYS